MNEQNSVRIIEVVPYSSKWKDEYIKESEKLKNIFKDEMVEIHHIGSTSIPGIYAKPTIDIIIGVKDIDEIDNYNKDMAKLGYEAKGENGIKDRRFFIRGRCERTHHVHVFQIDNPEIKRHLNFRDYMIAHPEEAKEYGDLKKRLAKKFKYNSQAYCDGKDLFIKYIDKKATEWSDTK
ncbi:GrpB family protein [Anaerosalibacter bizertensis]|uniref:GrpB family protein n=1 Tax=Anaerosalibacter bizertensis TaxID=932217 RepID=UPI0035180B70